MPLKAFCKELNKDVLWNDFSTIPTKNHYSCPHCSVVMIPVNGELKIHHFRHKVECPYQTEPETAEHIQMKAFMFENLPKFNYCTKIELEKRLGDQIADVYCEMNLGNKVAIECQCSSLSVEKLLERTLKYAAKNIFVLWILKMPEDMEDVSGYYFTKLIELELYQMYFARVYYFDTKENNVWSVHFKKAFYKDKFTDEWIVAARKRQFDAIKLEKLGLCTVKNNGYNIARFYDKKFWVSAHA